MFILLLSLLASEAPATSSVQIAPVVTHQQAIEAAAKDLQSLPPEIRKLTRYLWIGTLPEKEWPLFWRTMSFHCNSLSTEPEIIAPRQLQGGSVAAINVRDYGPNWPTVWEKLTDAEPYFHVRLIQITEKKVKNEQGKTVTKKQEKVETVIGPWAEGPAMKALVEGTQSTAPIVRADWLLWKTSIQADRGEVGYYKWLGIKDQKSYEELIGFDRAVLKRFPIESRAVVEVSTVTLMPRRLDRFGKINGAYWLSSDVRVAQGKANPLQFLNGDFTPEAHEGIATLPNSLHAYALFNNEGKLVDSAPDFIASDGTAHNNDKRVHVGMSCVACHGPNAGINSINDWARRLAQKPLSLSSPDYETAKKLQRLYFSNLEPVIDDDRRQYVRAVAQATGWKAEENAPKYRQAFAAYDSPLNADAAARECGVTTERLLSVIKEAAANTPEVDVVVGSLLSDKTLIPRVVWEESFPKAMTMVWNREAATK